jgi:hypothetical protein
MDIWYYGLDYVLWNSWILFMIGFTYDASWCPMGSRVILVASCTYCRI